MCQQAEDDSSIYNSPSELRKKVLRWVVPLVYAPARNKSGVSGLFSRDKRRLVKSIIDQEIQDLKDHHAAQTNFLFDQQWHAFLRHDSERLAPEELDRQVPGTTVRDVTGARRLHELQRLHLEVQGQLRMFNMLLENDDGKPGLSAKV